MSEQTGGQAVVEALAAEVTAVGVLHADGGREDHIKYGEHVDPALGLGSTDFEGSPGPTLTSYRVCPFTQTPNTCWGPVYNQWTVC